MEAVRAQDDSMIVQDPAIGKYFLEVLLPNTQWILTCGAGISVVFGSSVSGHEGSTGNDVEINLAYNAIDETDCVVLGPRLGKRLNEIFPGSVGSMIQIGPFPELIPAPGSIYVPSKASLRVIATSAADEQCQTALAKAVKTGF
jgi:hypothetical protein